MSKEDTRPDPASANAHEEPAEEAAGETADREASAGGESGTPSPEERVSELNDKLLRALAEIENTRRRAEREREDVRKFAVSKFARDMLDVADNLTRALGNIPAELRGNDGFSQFLSGVELTAREFASVLERHGITKVDPMGEKFDHNFHQAMFEVETPDQPPGTVVQVAQPGYVIEGRLLRPAMVGVSKAAPQASQAKPAESAAANDDGAARGGSVDTQA